MPEVPSGQRVVATKPGVVLTALPVPMATAVRLSGAERLRRMAEGRSGLAVQRVPSTGWRIFISRKPGALGRFVGVAEPHPGGGLRLGRIVEPDFTALAERLAAEP